MTLARLTLGLLDLLAPPRCAGCDLEYSNASDDRGTSIDRTSSGSTEDLAERSKCRQWLGRWFSSERGGARLPGSQFDTECEGDDFLPRRYFRSEGAPGFCDACAPLLEVFPTASPLLPNVGAAYHYGGPLADAIRRFKYQPRSELASTLGPLLARHARRYVGVADVVIPVPLHPRRLRVRGFNQAALLSAHVARALGVRMNTSGLRRIRDTEPQAALDPRARVLNIRGAFVASSVLACKSILLVDDVRTTGATFASACEALRRADAASVHCLALAGAP